MEENMSAPSLPMIGERFPDVEVNTTQGTIHLPGDYRGKWFVLFSHPGDFTPVCTTEFVEFQKRSKDFHQLNTELIGLSVDRVFSHLKWIEWIKNNLKVSIKFPIIDDSLGRLATRLGMIHPKKGANTVRTVFIMDDQGIVRLILHYPPEVGRNIDEILRAITALQTADNYGVATPANWPNNRIIGNNVFMPPANDLEAIGDRIEQSKAGEIKCYDWWFCFKDLT